MNSAAASSNVEVVICTTKKSKPTGKRQTLAADIKELVGNTVQNRNWRGIAIALLVIVIVLALIVSAIVLLTPENIEEQTGDKITLQEFLSSELQPQEVHPIWSADGTGLLYQVEDGSVHFFNCTDRTSAVFMDNATFRELNTRQYKSSYDRAFVLLPYNSQQVHSHSTLSEVKLYNANTSRHIDYVGPAGPLFQYISWSPTANSLVFVQDNNIYFQKDITHSHVQSLTSDGMRGVMYNGVPDWLYEEEILKTDNAIWWSDDGDRIAYGVFNDTNVRQYEMPYFGSLNNPYVEKRAIPYPKPGTTNPSVTLRIWDIASNKTTELKPPGEFKRKEFYFSTFSWKDADHVLVGWMNRPQNMTILTVCDARTGDCRDNYRAVTQHGWVEVYPAPLFTPRGNWYFLVLPQKDGSTGSYKHVAMIDANVDLTSNHYAEGSRIFLTVGQWDVFKIVGYNENLRTIYFISVQPGEPLRRHLYSVSTSRDDSGFKVPVCLSCKFREDCQFVDASFSRNGQYYILACKGPGVPTFSLMATPDTLVAMLEDNAKLQNRLNQKYLPKIEYHEIPISETEHVLAKLILPPVLKKHEVIKYNLLMSVNGAPGTQLVTDEYRIGWEHYLVSTRGLVVAVVDGRGTSGRGDNWLHATHKRLGTLEVEDTLTAGRYFTEMSFINEKTAIWGWSYGGFLAALAMSRVDSVFNCGLTVAPVTDWRYYNSFFSERYMGLPTAEDNLEAYNYANVSRYANNFQNTRLLIVHGTGDYKVHFQHTAQFMKSLTRADVHFRSQIYTDDQHMLNRGNTETHLYKTLEDFLLQCYRKPIKTGKVNDHSGSPSKSELSES